MFSSIRRAFSAYTAKPFLFMWGSFIYLFMLLIFLLAVLGFVLVYFMAASVLSYEIAFDLTVEALPNLVVVAAIVILFIYFMGIVNAALAKTYRDAVDGVKTSLVDFYYYGLSRAPMMFSVVLMRELITLLIIGPIAAIYYFYLTGYEYMDIVFYLVAFFFLTLIHMIFTPALISAALGSTPFDSFRTAFLAIKQKHIRLVGMYILFGFVLLLNFIPLVQLFTIFIIYPVIYSALILFVTEKSGVAVTPRPSRR